MEVKSWLSINFLMKGMPDASYILGVELHRECFEIFFYGKLQTCQLPLIKGIILCEELCLNSWGKRKNKCPPYLGHYSCDLNLAMPFEVLLFWLAWYLTLVGIVSKWKENLGKIVEIIGNTYSVMSKNHGLFIIVCWSQPVALHWYIDVFGKRISMKGNIHFVFMFWYLFL